jgi:hypothetical protein
MNENEKVAGEAKPAPEFVEMTAEPAKPVEPEPAPRSPCAPPPT